jgi:hypothetical protein
MTKSWFLELLNLRVVSYVRKCCEALLMTSCAICLSSSKVRVRTPRSNPAQTGSKPSPSCCVPVSSVAVESPSAANQNMSLRLLSVERWVMAIGSVIVPSSLPGLVVVAIVASVGIGKGRRATWKPVSS